MSSVKKRARAGVRPLTNKELFPGAGSKVEGIRLPGLPPGAQPYDPPVPIPPVPQEPPTLGVGEEFEAFTTDIINVAPYRETSVAKLHRQWTSCDVYINYQPTLPLAYISYVSIFIYAVSAKTRTLVASGRLWYDPAFAFGQISTDQDTDKWIAAVRCGAERFEVTAYEVHTLASPNPTPGLLRVTVVGSNNVDDPPPNLGQVVSKAVGTSGGSTILSSRSLTVPGTPRYEVLAVQALNTAAAPRYLQLFDSYTNTAAGLPNDTPVRVWPLGAAIGSGISDPDVRYRSMLFPTLAISSNPLVFTAVADGVITWTLR